MKRNIVRIDAEKCTGCGLCAEACEEGAIRMIGGKAVLVNEAHCDGLGACLPACPAGAITIEEREAEPFSDPGKAAPALSGIPMACPGSGVRRIVRNDAEGPSGPVPGRLSQWPVQLRLVPSSAPFFDGSDLLVAADCSAYAFGDFHERFIKGRAVLVGCPKLDPPECWSKMADILSMHDIRSVTVTRMEVPCCSALVRTVTEAVKASGKDIPVKVCTITAEGGLKEE
ncbi:MAG: ferredoxin [Thermoplasmata archaeon]|nr:ferredoxin [Thermoplasmata archaeon]